MVSEAAQEVHSNLREEVAFLIKDLAQVVSQCKRAQSANEATLQGIQEQTQDLDTAISVEASTGNQLKAGEESQENSRRTSHRLKRKTKRGRDSYSADAQ
jgi:hypothetical protein